MTREQRVAAMLAWVDARADREASADPSQRAVFIAVAMSGAALLALRAGDVATATDYLEHVERAFAPDLELPT